MGRGVRWQPGQIIHALCPGGEQTQQFGLRGGPQKQKKERKKKRREALRDEENFPGLPK